MNDLQHDRLHTQAMGSFIEISLVICSSWGEVEKPFNVEPHKNRKRYAYFGHPTHVLPDVESIHFKKNTTRFVSTIQHTNGMFLFVYDY